MSDVARVFDAGGPVHAAQAGQPVLAWCGVRRQFRHVERDGTVVDVTCPRCRAALRAGQPRAWSSR